MKSKLRIIAIIALVAGVLLSGSGLLSESGLFSESIEAVIGLISLTISIYWLMIYSATYSTTGEKPKGKEKVLAIISVLQLSIPLCALFWWVMGSHIWPDNTILKAVSLCLALPCLRCRHEKCCFQLMELLLT